VLAGEQPGPGRRHNGLGRKATRATGGRAAQCGHGSCNGLLLRTIRRGGGLSARRAGGETAGLTARSWLRTR
jgi:hypothetical protein